jgi:Fe-S-cluster containining protein
MIDSGITAMKQVGPEHQFGVAATAIDSCIIRDKRDLKTPLSCDGCQTGDCCYIHVGTVQAEVEGMFSFMKRMDFTRQDLIDLVTPEGMERLRIQALAMKDVTDNDKMCEEYANRVSFENRRCVFLSDDKRCLIYPFRPLLCRTQFSTDLRQLCHCPDNNTNHPILLWASWRAECAFVSYTQSVATKEVYAFPVALAKFIFKMEI